VLVEKGLNSNLAMVLHSLSHPVSKITLATAFNLMEIWTLNGLFLLRRNLFELKQLVVERALGTLVEGF
jgi:hypothetical protein